MFEPLKRTETVPEQIAGRLRRAILGEELAVGQRLPSENTLSQQFETNRVSLRQALQILKASGLIEGGQGRSWRVADFRRGGLHWLPEYFEVRGLTQETVNIIEDFLSIRTPVLHQVLRMAMKRCTEGQLGQLGNALARLEEVTAAGNTEEIFKADLDWFEALLEASNSLLYRSVYRPFEEVYRKFSGVVVKVWQPPAGYPKGLREIYDAIVAKKAEEAEERLISYLNAESNRLRETLEQLLEVWSLKEVVPSPLSNVPEGSDSSVDSPSSQDSQHTTATPIANKTPKERTTRKAPKRQQEAQEL